MLKIKIVLNNSESKKGFKTKLLIFKDNKNLEKKYGFSFMNYFVEIS